MKKICLIFLFSLFALSCSTNTAASSSNSNVLDSKVDKKIVWEMGGHLPAQTGMEKNIGTAGVLYGSLGGKYIVVGGGANFPEESVLNGGAKKTYSDIYMLDGIYYIGGSSNPEADDDILFITLKDNKLNVEKIGDLPFTLQNGGV